MKYFDFSGQTIIVVATAVLTIPFGGSIFLLGALVIGVWQFSSSVLTILAKAPFRKHRIIHLSISTVFLGFFISFLKNLFVAENTVFFLVTMMTAGMIAVYYYVITYWWAFAETKRSKFLPNISF